MSVFSKLKMSKKAAKEHKEKVKEQEAEPVKVSYKHVPTHAAFDALSGSPSSWSHGDRPKIQEQHKRRSQMAVSRTGSSLSTTRSYMNASTNPNLQAPQIARNSSYNSYQPTWNDRGDNSSFLQERSEHAAKRQRSSRNHSYHDSGVGSSVGPSPLASNMQSEEASPVISSGNSTNSEHSSDNLEMPSKPRIAQRVSYRQAPQPIVYAEQNIFDQLHTSTTRKLGEAPLYTSPPVVVKAPAVVSAVETPQKKKKNRWSMLSKRNTISAM